MVLTLDQIQEIVGFNKKLGPESTAWVSEPARMRLAGSYSYTSIFTVDHNEIIFSGDLINVILYRESHYRSNGEVYLQLQFINFRQIGDQRSSYRERSLVVRSGDYGYTSKIDIHQLYVIP